MTLKPKIERISVIKRRPISDLHQNCCFVRQTCGSCPALLAQGLPPFSEMPPHPLNNSNKNKVENNNAADLMINQGTQIALLWDYPITATKMGGRGGGLSIPYF